MTTQNTTMTPDVKGLLAAEEARRVAMVDHDLAKLGALLADDLVYTHSNGGNDTKQQYIDKLSSGALRYDAVEFNDVKARVIGTVGLLTAGMKASVTAGTAKREVGNTYLAAWEYGAAGWTLLLLQGSPLPAAK